ncbi:hypothetical protein BDK51DRAFT_43850 [Blyttiomyces helicus]|uniref:Uncharacterized protein n=1 Tax=Blyttiomyces helicus TaxID=388810 RepID=A0A4P9WQA3_9FUNG|nr:hypothetical protein BDK51DRAFT_43850 [Blyttiomyces helicus]|eukprot:RKO93978.1 hypothetical protein BDK51DRAFT_43850 [Blyttiomyces helicus]
MGAGWPAPERVPQLILEKCVSLLSSTGLKESGTVFGALLTSTVVAAELDGKSFDPPALATALATRPCIAIIFAAGNPNLLALGVHPGQGVGRPGPILAVVAFFSSLGRLHNSSCLRLYFAPVRQDRRPAGAAFQATLFPRHRLLAFRAVDDSHYQVPNTVSLGYIENSIQLHRDRLHPQASPASIRGRNDGGSSFRYQCSGGENQAITTDLVHHILVVERVCYAPDGVLSVDYDCIKGEEGLLRFDHA